MAIFGSTIAGTKIPKDINCTVHLGSFINGFTIGALVITLVFVTLYKIWGRQKIIQRILSLILLLSILILPPFTVQCIDRYTDRMYPDVVGYGMSTAYSTFLTYLIVITIFYLGIIFPYFSNKKKFFVLSIAWTLIVISIWFNADIISEIIREAMYNIF